MASALGLRQAGWQVTVVERAPQRRVGGYFVGLFGTGLSAARRLGVLDTIHTRTPVDSRTWEVNRAGNRRLSAGFLDQPGNPEGALRGDIEAGLFESLGDTEVRYATTPVRIADTGNGTRVTTRNTSTGEEHTEEFDLVVGADGIRSTVRRLVFGPDELHLQSLGAVICAFKLQTQVPFFRPGDGIVLAEPRRSVWVFPFADTPPTVLFSYRVRDIDARLQEPADSVLRRVYGPEPFGDLLEFVFDQFAHSDGYVFDSVNHVTMHTWISGRTVLVGDAAWCPTLYSGMGASLALTGGSFLGQLLARYPEDIDRALRLWEAQLRPFTRRHQRAALVKAQIFTPSGPVAHILRRGLLAAGAEYNDKDSPNAINRFFTRPMNADFTVDAVPNSARGLHGPAPVHGHN